MSEMNHIPVVDLSKSKTHRMEEAMNVVNGLENVGLLYVDNIKDFDFDKLMTCCRWVFNQSDDVKNNILKKLWNNSNKNVYRGYFPVIESQASRKEGFDFGKDIDWSTASVSPENWFYEESVWPKEDGKFPFKQFLQDLYGTMHETAMEILRLAAVGLGIEEHSFTDMFSYQPCSTFRLLHYPPWIDGPPDNARTEDGRLMTTPDHTDSGFLTLLATFSFQGLEYVTPNGNWMPVKPRPNSLVINIGDLFSHMVGGRFKATRHRVIDIGIDRFSVPFFLEPNYDREVGFNLIERSAGEDVSSCEKYGPWVNAQMARKGFYEFVSLPKF
ncbi:uncharacterized protein LOC110446864 isoform X1 [Mizuhopecten yessoensis]|uniref:Isopenicillin N synthase n=1 Tax=Mizuhopecten yessoensis TaxID=6573 RepID=A0A210QWJ6_MIZYE|nr:uncharacterized protein LOC110446864 isoform X1 [Mizuhopecten yessoensis]XP_021347874.1 uncharacterized protein LOC110446864 isoform X1 [Mizuhopecten yessoensis]OWF53093.1 Isopenicillin N synthase [Mizuhopecten yessoensis]